MFRPRLAGLAVLALALAACGGGGGTTDDPTTPDEQASSPAPATSDPAESATPSEAATSPSGRGEVVDATGEFTVTLAGTEYDGTYEVATNQITGCTVGILSADTFVAQFGGTEGVDPVVYIDLAVPGWQEALAAGTSTTFASSLKFAPSNVPHVAVDTTPESQFPGGSGTVTITQEGDVTTVQLESTTADGATYELDVVCHSMYSA